MEDWNIKQVIGMVLMILGGLFGLIAFVMLLFTVLRPEVAGGILIVLTMMTGIWLWKNGSKENDKKD